MQLNDVIRLIHRMISEQLFTETVQHTDMGELKETRHRIADALTSTTFFSYVTSTLRLILPNKENEQAFSLCV